MAGLKLFDISDGESAVKSRGGYGQNPPPLLFIGLGVGTYGEDNKIGNAGGGIHFQPPLHSAILLLPGGCFGHDDS